MAAVVPFAKLPDKAALQHVNHVFVALQQRRQLADMLQRRLRRRPCQRRRQLIRKTQQQFHASRANFREKRLDVVQLALRQITTIVIAVQKTITLHDGHAVIREKVDFILPLRMAEFDAVQAISANQMRHARHVNILEHRHFRPTIQFVPFAMARACSRDFPWNAAEIHLRPEAALRIPQPRPAMQIIRPYAAKLLFH